MELTILGFMGGYPSKGIGTSSYVLESDHFHLLIDVGSNAVLALEQQMDPLDIDAVILTHYHPDHIADLGVLQHVFLLKEQFDKKEKSVLPIYGHAESELHKLRTHSEVTKGVNYSGKEKIEIGPFHIEFLRTIHPVPCFALQITEIKTNKKLVFTADSGYMEEFIPFSKNAELLLADTNFFEEGEHPPIHMTSKEVGTLAQSANVKEVVLTHLPPEGDWQKLLKETQAAAGPVHVSLAVQGKKISI